MVYALLTVEIRFEQDVVLARQRARQIAILLGFEAQDPTRIATAVSDVVRFSLNCGSGSKVEFFVEEESIQLLLFIARISFEKTKLNKSQPSLDRCDSDDLELGLLGAKRLMDRVWVESLSNGKTAVSLSKVFPQHIQVINKQQFAQIVENLARQTPQTPYAEIQQQNQELLQTLAELRQRQEELAQLNQELEVTNRGVVALYAELSDRADDLKLASEVKSRFLSYMSHEFRTPLNAIVSLSNMLLARLDGDLTSEQEKQVSFINRSAQSLTELVNDLLDIAKVEAGKFDVCISTVEVADLFGALRVIMRPLLAQKNDVELIFEDISPEIASFQTDEGKVSQILRNLISNAIKYTERGEVRVSVGKRGEERERPSEDKEDKGTRRQGDKRDKEDKADKADKGENYMKVSPIPNPQSPITNHQSPIPNQFVVFSVVDTGLGIAPEDRDRIFEEFVRLDDFSSKRLQGTGLGLPLCKKLVDLLGGRIEVDSELGVGSTFSVILPMVDATETKIDLTNANKASELSPQIQSPIKILIIDDNEIDRYTIKNWLLQLSCTAIEASNGYVGLELARTEKPQAILLDIVMPDLTGFEVLEQLKLDANTRDIPVIIISSMNLETSDCERLAVSAVAILSKENDSQEQAIALLKQALIKAGIKL
jgi:signal transduction histidine kinase/ActR/RegA family two-component response regulator